MWNTREESLKALNKILKKEAGIIYEGFEIIEKISQKLGSLSDSSSYLRVCGLVLIKGRNLCQGIFSLSLEGLAQECGALLRPTIECIELLEYFFQDPKRVGKALNGKLPCAGKIAKEIKGKFKGLRDYLNVHASHLSIGVESMAHLINWNKGSFKTKQIYSEKVLKTNLSTLFCFLALLCISAVNCLSKCNSISDKLYDQINCWREKGLKIVKPTLSSSEKILDFTSSNNCSLSNI
jgi:hypothetical protein